MMIKRKGTYIAYGPNFTAIIKIIGEIPHFIIVSGIELNSFIENGEVKELKKDSLELLQIAEFPERFVFAPLDILHDAGQIKLNMSPRFEQIEFDEIEMSNWVQYYKELTAYNMDLNKLRIRIMSNNNSKFSYGQANLILEIIKRKLSK